MRIPSIDPQSSPFSAAQAAHFNAFLGSLSPDQVPWLLGYLTGIERAQSGKAAPDQDGPALEASPEVGAVSQLTVLYASQTGNAAKVARKLGTAAVAAGIPAVVISVGDYPASRLRQEQSLVLISSTQGEGDPPDSAMEFRRVLFGKRAPCLNGLRFAVFALGDYSYANFCQAGVDFDRRLAELGAERALARVDCDVEFEPIAEAWQGRVLEVFRGLKGGNGQSKPTNGHAIPINGSALHETGVAISQPAVFAPDRAEPTCDKTNPFYAPVLESIDLNGRGSGKKTVHLELSLAGSGITYQPGDSLGVLPRNSASYVRELLLVSRLAEDSAVTVDGQPRTLLDALVETFEVTTITRPFLKAYAAATHHADLGKLLEPGQKGAFRDYVHGREIIDVVTTYPPAELSAQAFVGMLRRLQPRLYSIASSRLAHEEEAHLLVGLTRYESHGRAREGVCSGYICERRAEDERLRVYLAANPRFRLPPSPDARIIMIGPGTGVAPFRAFVEERAELGCRGRNWLFFGDRHFTTDFLYQVEWQRWYKARVLSRIDLAFSRDQAEKIYVQHRMLENARDLYAWLQEGAYLYVCGDASAMAVGVHETLITIASRQGGKSREEAVEYVEGLQASKRYLRDVY